MEATLEGEIATVASRDCAAVRWSATSGVVYGPTFAIVEGKRFDNGLQVATRYVVCTYTRYLAQD